MVNFSSALLTTSIALVAIALILLVKSKSSDSGTDHHEEQNTSKESGFQCNLYMAPSSIPNSGYGVFTTRAIKTKESVLPYGDVPDIVVTDMDAHTGNIMGDYWTHVDYLWRGDGLAVFEGEHASANVLVLGCLLNYHTFLKNLHVS